MQEGYIYILQNAALDGYLKIGMTTRSPRERAHELSQVSGVVVPFNVAYSERVVDCEMAEKMIHSRLSKFRVTGRREFFYLTVQNAIHELREIAVEVGQPIPTVPTPELPIAETDFMPPETTKRNPQGESDKRQLYHRFWTRLLENIQEKTERFKEIHPTEYYYVQMLPGPERGIFFYLSLNESSIRVEIFFNSGEDTRNTELYERLERNRSSIEGKFNKPIVWRHGKTCGIKYTFGLGCYRNEEDWQKLIAPALESLLLFEGALMPFLTQQASRQVRC